MTPELIKAAADNPWMAIAPEIALVCLALLLLVAELLLPRSKHGLVPAISVAGQLGILCGLLVNWQSIGVGQPIFNGLLMASPHTQFLRAFLVASSLLVSLLGVVALAKQKMPKIEFFVIVQIVSAALMLLTQANHFVLFFVALEAVAIGFYILVSYVRTNPLTLEAGLKYLIMGALSSGILLFGIVLLYGVAGNPTLEGSSATSMNFDSLYGFLQANPDNFLASVGIVLVLSGVAFKIGAVPFQIWIPDVYQGASTPVTAFLAVSSKAAGFAVLLTLVNVFAPYASLVATVIAVMAFATIIFGNLAALTQHNVKRLIGLSGVSHAGYLLIGVLAAMTTPLIAAGAIYFYLFAYLLASFAVFGVMVHVAGVDDADQELDHYAGLAKSNPFLGGVLAIGLGSLAGIPPLAGFMGKLLVFMTVFNAAGAPISPLTAGCYYGLLGVAVLGVVISIYYYFGWVKAAYFETWRAPLLEGETDPTPARTPVGGWMRATLGLLALGSIVFGVYQGPITTWLVLR